MKASKSEESKRVFSRKNSQNKYSPYYEYRDTAMSRLGPFKPEWIKELRIVNNDDPYNPDVAFNNGHSLHQITFFIGPVNFYWQINGQKLCKEMNTGDSNYITPFWPHSFTSRDPDKEAFILAITFGGDVRRALKEMYSLGERSRKYMLEYRDHKKAVKQLIRQHMMNENLTEEQLNQMAEHNNINLDLKEILYQKENITRKNICDIARLLNIEPEDLSIPRYNPEDEVVIKHNNPSDYYLFPNENDPNYKIMPLARTTKMPLVKGFSIKIVSNQLKRNMITSLHSYVYNYGESEIIISWKNGNTIFEEKIKKNDSLYIQPFIKHGFSCKYKNGKIYVARVSGSVNLSTQRELSYMSDMDRVFKETKSWFN